ncbi:MAG: 30S ribosomal protein S2, partial [Candidatus Diapherotrites archaeon]|nr:30S ribosomal protein S2 [Candidatus Diapherotrites archaeon]
MNTEEKPTPEIKEDSPASVDDSKFLVPTERYLKTGSHIGTKFKAGEMRKFIFKTRKDGLNVFDITTIDQRISVAARFLSRFEPRQIMT